MFCISSYAILPLRKHLMQKSMLERRSLDDNQYSYINSDLERDNSINNSLGSRQHKQRMIRPLEEVMEEEQSPTNLVKNTSTEDSMDYEDSSKIMPVLSGRGLPPPGYFTPYVGIGPSGISPLVLSDPRVAVNISPDHVGQRVVKTGIGFHSAMLKHQCHCENTKNHPENPERLNY